MEKTGNETSEIDINEAADETKQTGGQETRNEIVNSGQKTGAKTIPPFLKWDGLSQTWEHITKKKKF